MLDIMKFKMLKFITLGFLLYNMGRIVKPITLEDAGVCADNFGNLSCCFNYRLHNDVCVACSIGYTLEDDVCVPCKLNTYGHQCLWKCTCNFDQRCDRVLGCVYETTTTQTTFTMQTTWNQENETQARTTLLKTVELSDITNKIPTKKYSYGLLDREIVIYSVVVACIMVIFGLSYLVFRYRQLTSKTLVISSTTQNTRSIRRHSLVDSSLNIYDEIAENMLEENVNINMMQINDRSFEDEIQRNIDNTSYLYPFHQEEKSTDTSVSVKSVNDSYFSFYESDQNTNSDQSQKEDDTISYLHPYHTIDKDWKERSHKYDITHVHKNNTNDSSHFSTQMINKDYFYQHQHQKEDGTQTYHSYEAPVTVHHYQSNSAVLSVSDEELKEKSNDDNQIRKVKDIKVAQIREAAISTYNRQEMADDIYWNDKRKEYSMSVGNNRGLSTELTEINNIATNDLCSTQRENASAPNVESDINVFD